MHYQDNQNINLFSSEPLVKNQALVILLDSGSSHTFLNKALTQKLQLSISLIAPMAVKVADGASLSCSAEVRQFEWWIGAFNWC
jgi:predicted aspartyl protease